MHSDEELILELRRGSQEAFTELFLRYRQRVYGFFRRRMGDAAQAEELAQETFLAVLRAAQRYEPRATFRAYLFGIAFNILAAHRRKASAESARRNGASGAASGGMVDGAGGGETIGRAGMRRDVDAGAMEIEDASGGNAETVICVRQAVGQLQEMEREIVMLREFEELRYEEIAKIMGIPLNTVRSRLFRAREALREILTATGGGKGLSKGLGRLGASGISGSVGRRSAKSGIGRSAEMSGSGHQVNREEVMAYLDGELPAERASSVGAHLGECVECAALAEELRGVSSELAKWSVEEASVRMTERVLEAATVTGVGAWTTTGREVKRAGVRDRVEEILAEARDKVGRLPRAWVWGAAGAVVMAFLILVVGVPVRQARLEKARREQNATRLSGYVDEKQRESVAQNLENKDGRPIAPALMAPSPPTVSRARMAMKNTPAGMVGGAAGGTARFARNAVSTAAANAAASETAEVDADEASPMIAKTATLQLSVKDFGPVEASVKAIVQRHGGYIGELSSASPTDGARSLSATLRIPTPGLEAAINDLKQLGHVEQEDQAGEEVSKQFVDRDARLKNSRATEQRLVDVLRDRTGKVKDILEVEQEIARVRGEIEQMEADQRDLKTRVDFATVELTVQEEYKAKLDGGTPPSTGRRLRNAAVEGYRAAVESVLALGVWLLASLPTLVLWAIGLFVPARWIWKRGRRALARQSAAS